MENQDHLSRKEKILYNTLFIVPFLGFALVSYLHGYNYLIYPSYTNEFAISFFIFGLSYFSHGKEIIKRNLIGNFLMFFLIALPIISSSKVFLQNSKTLFSFTSVSIRTRTRFRTQQVFKKISSTYFIRLQLVSRYLLVSLCRRSS